MSDEELDDLQRYINATRAEILFSRGVIFVEGDAEELLVPVFAESLGHDLDSLGISVCNVGGINFKPYAKLAAALALPFSIITDWDPESPVDGQQRARKLITEIRSARGDVRFSPARQKKIENDEGALRDEAEEHNIFMNEDTLETEMATAPKLIEPILQVLSKQGFGARRTQRLEEWSADHSTIKPAQLMTMIKDVRKGRFSQQLAAKLNGVNPPDYIIAAIENIVPDD